MCVRLFTPGSDERRRLQRADVRAAVRREDPGRQRLPSGQLKAATFTALFESKQE